MRPDRFDLLFAVAAAAAAVALLGLGAGLTFYSDEWAFIESAFSIDPVTWFGPYNDHWTTLSRLLYVTILELVGLQSYVPYLVVLVAMHVVVAGLVYVLIRRTSGGWVALGTGVVILLFGSGFENLYWAFQITFLASMVTGLLAMLAFDARPLTKRRIIAGACLLLASLAMSGIGLISFVAIAVELLVDPSRRRGIVGLVLPAGVYGAWFLAFGRTGLEARQGLFRLGGLEDVPPVIISGLGAAVGALSGVGRELGLVVLVVVSVVVASDWIRRRRVRLSARAAGCIGAATALYALIAISRAFVGPEIVDYTRYTYESGVFLAVGVAAQVGRPSLTTATSRRAWLLIGGMVFTLALTWNIRLLVAGRSLFQERAERTRALLTVALERPLPSSTDPTRTLVLVPSPRALEVIVARFGSPLEDELAAWAAPPVSATALEAARRTLAEGAEIPLPDRSD